tara:strand:- start:2927 stop:4219 length:1293 start_codon:yes stop_codon:yes gene_type:complete
MAVPTLNPVSQTPAIALPSAGTTTKAQAAASYPFGVYADTTSDFYDANFVLGAQDQVAYTFKKLGGDILDIELTEENVYSAYEEAVLEYSYIVNVHQAKNALPNVLGNATGTFDHDGNMITYDGTNVTGSMFSLKYPKFEFSYSRRIMDGISAEAQVGGLENEYSASFTTTVGEQDYDLQSIIESASLDASNAFSNKVNNKRIKIKKVFFKTPHAMWRFYGYYGGLNVVGNLSTYGQYADDSTYEVIPAWQNKMQAMAYEDAIYTRNSHYSFEIKNNKLRIYPRAVDGSPKKMWVRFTIPTDAWSHDPSTTDIGLDGINNMNTLPFTNIPYKHINSIGKQWIRRFSLALTKEMLGQVRGKFSSIPIPGNDVQLNASDLLSQAKEEQEKLREELKTVLDELTYTKMAQRDSEVSKAVTETAQTVPNGIFVG